ncbi:MAG: DUF4340 domain-containing protein, partial [Verrucomicrobiae bacterium]|nr:DUF4340 domain-containing protein [Verrucomicrobiae bacterium]
KKYKLDEPQIELTLRTSKAGDPGQVLLIGAPIRDNPSGKPPAATAAVSDEEAEPGAGAQRHPAARWSAMRKGQPTIFAIGEKSIESLRPDLKEFRDEQLFHVDRRDVQSVVIQQSGGSMRIEKSGDGWKWAEPQSGGVDAELMDRFLSRTLGTKIQEFTTDVLTDVDRYGLADGAPVLRFYGAKNEKGEPALLGAIRLGSFNSKRTLRYVKREDESSIYGASAEDLKFIPASPLDLRDRVFLKILRDAARQISLRTSYGSYVLERSPRGEWTASGGLVDRGAVDRLLSAVSRLSAIRLVSENEKNPEAKYGLDRRAAELTIIEKNGEDVIRHELLVGETSSGPAYVYYRNKGLVAEIPHAIADDLTAPLLKKPSS